MNPTSSIAPSAATAASSASKTRAQSRWLPRGLVALSSVGLIVLGIWVEETVPFEPGSDFGYWMGVVGGSMMLALLLYPLRKHWGRLRGAGPIRHWFRLHMVLGICGPLIVLFHSTFRVGSLNGRIALYSMLIVAASGIAGRFIYARIHAGLYGQQLSLRDLDNALANSVESMNQLWLRAPKVRDRLLAFRDHALRVSHGEEATRIVRLRHFMTLGIRSSFLRLSVNGELRRVLDDASARERWSARRLAHERRDANEQVARFVAAVQGVARLSAWVRIFAWWHVAHAPLVYLLALSAVAHVVAVHMY